MLVKVGIATSVLWSLAAGHGHMTSPVSFPELESALRNNHGVRSGGGHFGGGDGMPGNFRYEPQSSAKGNGGGQMRASRGAECGGNSDNYAEGVPFWTQHYQAHTGVPVFSPGSVVKIQGTLPADHGGQFWVMIACDQTVQAQGAGGNNWVYLERTDLSTHNLGTNPRVVDWRSGSLRRFDFDYRVPANFGCASGGGVGRWLWKTGNSCIDTANVGRNTEMFNAADSATGRGPCRSPPETFISCFIFTTDATTADAPATPLPPPPMGGGDPMAGPVMTPPAMQPGANPMCTNNCPQTYCQNDCGRFSLAVCNGPNDGSWCRHECCCPYKSNCQSPNSVQSQSTITPGQSFMIGGEAIPYVAATGRNSNCRPCQPGEGNCMLQTCAMPPVALPPGENPANVFCDMLGGAVTSEQCNSVCTEIYSEGPDGTTEMGVIAPGNTFKQHQDEKCGTAGMAGTECTCAPLPAEQANPPGMMCRVCNVDTDPGCTATGEVEGAWCAEHCANLHFGDAECGAVPMPGMTVQGTHCVCSRVQTQQAAPGGPAQVIPPNPAMPAPAVPPTAAGPPPGAVNGAYRSVKHCGVVMLLFLAYICSM